MKKIFCNIKLKKIVLVMITLVMVFEFVLPSFSNVVYAVDISSYFEDYPDPAVELYYEQSNSIEFKYHKDKVYYKNYVEYTFGVTDDNINIPSEGNSYSATYDDIKLTIKNQKAIINNHEINVLETLDQIEKFFSISISGDEEQTFNVNINIKIQYYSQTGDQNCVTLSWTGSGAEPESAIDRDNEAKDEAFENANLGSLLGTLGGILLKPIFSFVDFVVENLTNFIYKFMLGTEGTVSPEQIFTGQIPLLSIDFIGGTYIGKDGNIKDVSNSDKGASWTTIRETISSWYGVLRLIALVGLLSMLIYTGIRIILSANSAKNQAKYKEWIINWILAIAILFFMHYIMAFIIAVINEFTVLFYNAITTDVSTNFVETLHNKVRGAIDFGELVAYEVMYVAAVFYTIKFLVIYVKRMLNVAFLTLIAPIVALMYPLDKLNDGSAQSFDLWIKEYIFNALLQPLHLLMWTILAGSAISIAEDNPLFAIIVLAFMTEAEKLLKKFFGFEKARGGTVGGMGSAFAAGAVASSVMNSAKKLGAAAKGGKTGGNDSGDVDLKDTIKDTGVNTFAALNGGVPDPDNVNNEDRREDEENNNNPRLDNHTEPSDSPSQNEQQEPQDNPQQDDQRGEQDGDNSPQDEESDTSVNRTEPVKTMRDRLKSIKESRAVAGAGAVVKSGAKKARNIVYNPEKSAAWNTKRWARRLGKFALGTTAAAVQAGISITDGKYNPLEGVASYAAGSAFGGKAVDKLNGGIRGIQDTYSKGAGTEAYKQRAIRDWLDRDDVIKFMQKQTDGSRTQMADLRERLETQYAARGITDLKDIKSTMNYADKLADNSNNNLTRDQADRLAISTANFEKKLKDEGALKAATDLQEQKKYIDAKVKYGVEGKSDDEVRKMYENAFKHLYDYRQAQK